MRAGSCTVFAVLPTPAAHPPVWEEYIAISPGVGGFAAGDIYVTQFENVYKISPDGSTVTLFATIPAFVNHDYFHSGITFDTSGNYGNKMIVTGQNFMDGHGQVYTINSAGTVTPSGQCRRKRRPWNYGRTRRHVGELYSGAGPASGVAGRH